MEIAGQSFEAIARAVEPIEDGYYDEMHLHEAGYDSEGQLIALSEMDTPALKRLWRQLSAERHESGRLGERVQEIEYELRRVRNARQGSTARRTIWDD